MFAFLALAVAPALAHIPHHTIDAIAVSRDLLDTETWYAVHTPYGVSNLMASPGGSHTSWQAVGGEPMADVLIGATKLDDGTIVLLSEAHLWWSSDGIAWESSDAPDGAGYLVGGEEIWVGTSFGVWRGATGSELEQSLEGVNVAHLSMGPAGVLAVAAGGAVVYVHDGKDWVDYPGPGTEVISGVYDSRAVYAGDIMGDVWRLDEKQWVPCGQLPEDTSGEESYPHVTHLASDGDRLLAVPAWKGPFVSPNGCATWEDRAAPLEVQFSQTSITEAFTTLHAAGDRWVIAGWDSIGVTTDAGATWTQAYIMPPDLTRGATYSPTFADDGYVYLGPNGAGVMRSDDGYHWDSVSGGLGYQNIQLVIFPPWAEDTDTIFALANHDFWRTDDGGDSWHPVATPHSYSFNIVCLEDPDRIWVFGRATAGKESTQLSQSLDDGESWDRIAEVDAALEGSTPYHATATPSGEICLTINNPQGAVCSSDGQKTWTQTFSGEGERVTNIYAWPPSKPTRLVFADDAGVLISDDDGQTWTRTQAMEEDTPYYLVQADDGTLFLATTSAALFRSTDGGDSFEDLGIRYPAQVFVMATRPDFATTPELMVGTHDGTYLLSDASGELPVSSRYAAYNLVDNDSTYVHWTMAPDMIDHVGAIMGRMQPFGVDTEATVGLRGDVVRVIGVSDGDSEVELEIDGFSLTFGDEEALTPQVLVELEGLGQGYHKVVLRGLSGDGFMLDALESGDGEVMFDAGSETGDPDSPPDTGPGDTEDSEDSPSDSECETGCDSEDGDTDQDGPSGRCGGYGCSSAAAVGGALWLLASLGLVAARRREDW